MNELSIEMKILLAGGIFVALVILALVYRKIPKKLRPERFGDKWKELQAFCRDKATWSDAILEADRLLDEALKRRKFKGKSMGERMVSAQRYFTNNDDLWFAHNLCKKLKADGEMKLKEADVKDALVGFRQGLRDLGALDNGEPRNS